MNDDDVLVVVVVVVVVAGDRVHRTLISCGWRVCQCVSVCLCVCLCICEGNVTRATAESTTSTSFFGNVDDIVLVTRK